MEFLEVLSKFDLAEFLNQLSQHEEKQDIIKKYKKHVQKNIKKITTIEEMNTYKNYLVYFDTGGIEIQSSTKLLDKDFDLLLKLVASSFSSVYRFQYDKEHGVHRLAIDVSSGDKSVTRYLDDLWPFQIYRMYEIYLEENMNLEILAHKDKTEKYMVISQRKENLEKFYQKKEQYFAERIYDVLTREYA
jgi:hypothetical protein